MDSKDISAILLKSAGLLMLAYAAFEIPRYFPPFSGASEQFSNVEALMQGVVTLALPVAVGLLLWFFPATVTNTIVSGEKLTGERFGAPELERVALTVVGAWLIASGIADLVYSVVTMVVLNRQFPDDAPILARYVPGIIASIVKVAFGVGLALGAKFVVRVVGRIRGQG